MIIDTSALIAIVRNEPERDTFLVALSRDPVRVMSIASYLEAVEVFVERMVSADAISDLRTTLDRFGITVSPISVEQGEIAAQARVRYGRGRHKAKLNFGDCFSYALAIATGEPLLFKGNDFIHTDVGRVL